MTIFDLLEYLEKESKKEFIEEFSKLPEEEQYKIISEWLNELIDKISRIIVKEDKNDS